MPGLLSNPPGHSYKQPTDCLLPVGAISTATKDGGTCSTNILDNVKHALNDSIFHCRDLAMENGIKNMNSSPVAFNPYKYNKEPKKSREWLGLLMIIVAPLFLCAILLIIFFYAVRIPPVKPYTSLCLGSAEANRSNLTTMLKNIEYVYFHKLHPEMIYQMAKVTPEDIRKTFRPFDPNPEAIRNRTELANATLNELNSLQFNTSLLKLRERKTVHVARSVLRNNFGWAPQGQDYFNGDWLLGPDLHCAIPVCSLLTHLNAVFSYFKPRNLTELEKLKDMFEEYNRTLERHVENWKYGVKAGYVRPLEACKAGLHEIKYVNYRGMTLKNEQGKCLVRIKCVHSIY